MKVISAIGFGATAALLFAAAGTGAADNRAPSDAQLRYQRERAACFTGQFITDRATCLREAGAALQEARRGGMPDANEREFAENRIARCKALPVPDQEDCVRRMSGEGSVSGSVEQGGIFREFTRTLPPPN